MKRELYVILDSTGNETGDKMPFSKLVNTLWGRSGERARVRDLLSGQTINVRIGEDYILFQKRGPSDSRIESLKLDAVGA